MKRAMRHVSASLIVPTLLVLILGRTAVAQEPAASAGSGASVAPSGGTVDATAQGQGTNASRPSGSPAVSSRPTADATAQSGEPEAGPASPSKTDSPPAETSSRPRLIRPAGPSKVVGPLEVPRDGPAQAATSRVRRKSKPKPKIHHKVHFFVGWTQGLGWWHHYEPPVIGSMRGQVGLSWNWLEFGVIVGSPAWGRWQTRAFFEFSLLFGIRSFRWNDFVLIHRGSFGFVCDNPPFDVRAVAFRFVPVVLSYRLWRGLWLEASPVTFTFLELEHFETTLGFRYEF